MNFRSGIAKNLDIALQVEKELSPPERDQVRALLVVMEAVQKEIDETMTEFKFQEKCVNCKDVCCSAAVSEAFLDSIDLLLILFEECGKERRRIINAVENFRIVNRICSFSDPEGCTIRSTRRPTICKIYFCDQNVLDAISEQRKMILQLRKQLVDLIGWRFSEKFEEKVLNWV